MKGLSIGKGLKIKTILPENIDECFKKYEDMQKKHLKILATELNPDIETFNFERSGTFETLKNELTTLINKSKNIGKQVNTDQFNDWQIENKNNDTYDIFVNCRSRISSILERDSIISKKIENFRNEIASHMQKIQYGKAAIRGYTQFNA
ncbi:MAG: hypothetical protein B6I31_02620 [Desulfobacteraceae bacterium 4572_19]|nr:MAG: hypothetical protein B6I31_02620 [Desulfobacteraceae bacterium 4572_19]